MGAIRYLRCSPSVGGDDCKPILAVPAWALNCPTPIKTTDWSSPRKRRRLTIKGSFEEASKPCVLQQPEDRADGVVILSEERAERMLVCESSRCIVRDVFCKRGVQAIHEEKRLRAQVLACQSVQCFFMTASIRQELTDAVAIAAALIGFKAVDVPCEPEDAIAAFNARRASSGRPEFCIGDGPLESLRTPTETVLDMEARLAQTNAPVTLLPLDFIDSLVDRLVARLPANKAFQDNCGGNKNPHYQAMRLRDELARITRCFVADASLGAGASSAAAAASAPHTTAAAAVTLAAQYLLFRNQTSRPDFFSLLEAPDCSDGLTRAQLQHALDDILGVFRLWKEVKTAKAS